MALSAYLTRNEYIMMANFVGYNFNIIDILRFYYSARKKKNGVLFFLDMFKL